MNTLKDLVVQIIGQYSPDIACEGIAQIDWVWVGAFLILLHLTIVFFKSIKEIFKGVLK